MPPNNSFNPQPTPPAPGPAPDPNQGMGPASLPTPVPPQNPAPFTGATGPMPEMPGASPAPMGASPAPNPFGAPAATPPVSPYASPPQPFGQPAQPEMQQPMAPPPMPAQPPKKKNTMLIVIVAFLVALVVAGLAIWWYVSQNQSANVITNGVTQSNTADEVKGINTVKWVVPEDVPTGYAKTSQSVGGSDVVQYADQTSYCIVVAATIPLKDAAGKAVTLQDALKNAADVAEQQGVTTTKSEVGDKVIVSDAKDNKYTFESSVLTQKVNVTGAPYTDRVNTVAYKDFNGIMVSISQTCPVGASDTAKTEMQAFVDKFSLETT